MKSLALIESPLQLICAMEAVKHLSLSNIDFALRKNLNNKNNEQLLNTAHFYNIKYNTFFSPYETSSPSAAIKSTAQLLKYLIPSYDKVILGSYYSKLQRIVKSFIRAKNIHYVDDGVATYLAHQNITKNYYGPSFITIFKDLQSKNSLKVEHISLQLLRSRATALVKPELVAIFIGQKLIQTNQLTKKDYFDTIIAATQGQRHLLYVAHRGEDEATLSEILALNNITIIKPNLPLEIFLIENNLKPVEIYSNTSTALFTLAEIFDAPLTYVIAATYKKPPPHLQAILSGLTFAYRKKPQNLIFQ